MILATSVIRSGSLRYSFLIMEVILASSVWRTETVDIAHTLVTSSHGKCFERDRQTKQQSKLHSQGSCFAWESRKILLKDLWHGARNLLRTSREGELIDFWLSLEVVLSFFIYLHWWQSFLSRKNNIATSFSSILFVWVLKRLPLASIWHVSSN